MGSYRPVFVRPFTIAAQSWASEAWRWKAPERLEIEVEVHVDRMRKLQGAKYAMPRLLSLDRSKVHALCWHTVWLDSG